MRVIEQIPVSQIQMDSWRIVPKTLGLIDHLRGGGKVPPIKVYKNGNGQYVIKDGRHRVTAFKMLGRKKILAKFSTEPVHKVPIYLDYLSRCFYRELLRS